MRQKTFIKQTSLAILLYFICLALAVAIDLIFFKVKNMYHTPALAAIFAGWVYSVSYTHLPEMITSSGISGD